MSPLIWLLVALIAGGAGYLAAWPAWRAAKARDARDLNSERYLAWRGRAVRSQHTSMREEMTAEERRRVFIGFGLGIIGAVALIAFFLTA